ncbi:MAG: hypothetical protein O3B74_03450 [Proteobacteria bacterium]|nr:hypothetical protein [Pseudomonadota bacterium]MDA1309352.1 hypothetical protein [Pseudomonadota bacterium]
MTNHRYAMKTLRGDYIRGGIGVAVTGSLLVGATTVTIFQYLLTAAALLFVGFVLRTWLRHRTVFELSEEGVWANGPMGKALRWSEITEIRLRYFSTQRDRKNGWFQLTLKSPAGKVSVDSGLDGFDAVLEATASAIRVNQLEISESTAENFAAAGFPVRAAAAPESTQKDTTGEE